MNVIRRKYKLPHKEYIRLYLEVLNPILPIHFTPKEIEVFSLLLYYNSDDFCNTKTRKLIQEELSLSNAGLSSYIKSLKDKTFIREEEFTKKLIPAPYIIPDKDIQIIEIMLENENT